MEKKSKVCLSPSDRLKKCIASDKVILKRVKIDMNSLISSIGSDISKLEKLQTYYIDLLRRIHLYDEQLFRLQYES